MKRWQIVLTGTLLVFVGSWLAYRTLTFNLPKQMILETNYGPITLELLTEAAPATVKNFVKLAESGFYDGTLFHRVVRGFMIQGGDPLTREFPKDWPRHGTGGPGYGFADERNGLALTRGVVAMANSGPKTNGSQFFIVTAARVDWLNGLGQPWHTPFARVIEGMAVVDKINQVAVDRNSHPLQEVRIERIERAELK